MFQNKKETTIKWSVICRFKDSSTLNVEAKNENDANEKMKDLEKQIKQGFDFITFNEKAVVSRNEILCIFKQLNCKH